MKNQLYKQIKQKAEYCLNCKNPSCQKACPLGNDIPKFINKIKEEKYKEAYAVLAETTIMQPICGLICPHEKQCQGSCVRGIKGEPVQIGELEAFIGNLAIENNWYKHVGAETVSAHNKNDAKKNQKIAIIGGGPAGLTCGAYLAKKGYDVTIYEKHNKLGGLLIYGIPEFRLNRELVGNWINEILNLGIKVEYNKELGENLDINKLKKEYDAIFISIGANKSIELGIEGESLDGVYGANEVLEESKHPNYSEKVVAIIGGGNVAIDTARTIKRLGAKKVYIIYRRAEEQMPAEKKEIEEAKKEKIEFLFQNNIVKIIGDNKVKEIELIKTELVKNDKEKRRVPINIEGSNYKLKVDYVLKAIGAKSIRNDIYGDVKLDDRDYIEINKKYKTSNKMIFAGGDIVGNRSTVAYASKAGKEAAEAIHEFLK